MREGRIPQSYSDCLHLQSPLAEVNDVILCVSTNPPEYCSSCPMHSTRIDPNSHKVHLPLVKMSVIDPIVEDRWVTRVHVTTIKNPDGTPRQWIVTLNAKECRAHGVKDRDELYIEVKKVRMP